MSGHATTVPVRRLVEMSRACLDHFPRVEPRRWDRTAVVVELVGEVGSLAHQVQRLEGFKAGGADRVMLADECSDVLFIALRLARADALKLPPEVPVDATAPERTGDLVVAMALCLGLLASGPAASTDALVRLIGLVGVLAARAGIDLTEAHRREMEICQGYFAASGARWPRPRRLRHPVATFRLWRLLKAKRNSGDDGRHRTG